MADLHPKVEALFKTSPTCSHGNYCEADVRRIAMRQQELEREECAKVCEEAAEYHRRFADSVSQLLCVSNASAIRRRGKP